MDNRLCDFLINIFFLANSNSLNYNHNNNNNDLRQKSCELVPLGILSKQNLIRTKNIFCSWFIYKKKFVYF